MKSDCSNCPSLLPPESPFVFWSIPRLAYLGLACTTSPLWARNWSMDDPLIIAFELSLNFFDR